MTKRSDTDRMREWAALIFRAEPNSDERRRLVRAYLSARRAEHPERW